MKNQVNRRLELFTAAGAVDNGGPEGMRGEVVREPGAVVSLMKLREAGLGDGSISYLLFRQMDGFSLIHLWAKPNFPLPRHSHDSDCLYYLVSGSIVFGSRTLRSGDGFFVPADVPYVYTAGPEGAEVLEVRHGPNSILTSFPSISDDRCAKDEEAVRSNQASWQEMKVCPTFAANFQGDEGAVQANAHSADPLQ